MKTINLDKDLYSKIYYKGHYICNMHYLNTYSKFIFECHYCHEIYFKNYDFPRNKKIISFNDALKHINTHNFEIYNEFIEYNYELKCKVGIGKCIKCNVKAFYIHNKKLFVPMKLGSCNELIIKNILK
jgi:hypothetical protein